MSSERCRGSGGRLPPLQLRVPLASPEVAAGSCFRVPLASPEVAAGSCFAASAVADIAVVGVGVGVG